MAVPSAAKPRKAVHVRSASGAAGLKRDPPHPALRFGRSARVAMPMLVKIARLMSWVRVMLARLLGHLSVPMPMVVKVARLVARMIVMLARNGTACRIAMTVLVEITVLVTGMIVVLATFLI